MYDIRFCIRFEFAPIPRDVDQRIGTTLSISNVPALRKKKMKKSTTKTSKLAIAREPWGLCTFMTSPKVLKTT